jgi:hypothetical protein
MVRENLRVAQSRQKGYVDHRRRELSFEVGDFVYLKISPMRGLRRFKVRGKLAPRFIGPFKILEKRGKVAYQLELSPQLSDAHDMFHCPWKTWMLKKIFHIKNIPSKFWKHLKELLRTRRSRCARCNGAIIPRKKLLGKEKNS